MGLRGRLLLDALALLALVPVGETIRAPRRRGGTDDGRAGTPLGEECEESVEGFIEAPEKEMDMKEAFVGGVRPVLVRPPA